MPAPPPVTTATLSLRRFICASPVLPFLRLWSGLLQPDIHGRRTARSDAGVGVAEDRQVRSAVAVEIADVDSVLVVGAVFQRQPLNPVLAQAVLAAEEDKHLIGLPVGDDQIVDTVAI